MAATKKQGKKSKSQRKKTKQSKTQKKTKSISRDKESLKKDFMKLQCAPNPNKAHSQTCFSHESLIKLRNLWNARHPDKKITSNSPCIIWNHLKSGLGNLCNNEACWLRQHFIKENLDYDLLNYTFAPKSPSTWLDNPNEWLSSVDIEKVMKQYERFYPHFEFIGPSPIDYDHHKIYGECVWPELCEFNLAHYLKKNISQIGIVFNLDPHYKGGSHWVAIFVDLKKCKIYYFDSYGYPPHKQIKKLIKEIEKQCVSYQFNMETTINEKRHQYGNSECGMYCLFFIISMLKGEKYKNFEKKRFTDEYMLMMRKKFFNSEI